MLHGMKKNCADYDSNDSTITVINYIIAVISYSKQYYSVICHIGILILL
jgi:hypothetical protein